MEEDAENFDAVEEDASKARISFRNLKLQIFNSPFSEIYGNFHVPLFCHRVVEILYRSDQERSSSYLHMPTGICGHRDNFEYRIPAFYLDQVET